MKSWKDDRRVPPQRVAVGERGARAVPQHVAGGRHVQRAEQLRQRRLARAVLPDERDDLAGLDRERDAVERRAVAAGIGERHVTGHDRERRAAQRLCGDPVERRPRRRVELEERDDVADEEGRLVEVRGAEAAEDDPLPEQQDRRRSRRRVREAHAAVEGEHDEQRERATRDHGRGEVREQREPRLAPGDAAQLGDALVVERVVARAQHLREAERPHLLRGIAARQQRSEVAALAVPRRHPEREAVDRLAALRRDQRGRDDDERRQRREHGLQREQRDERSGGAGQRHGDHRQAEDDHRRTADAGLRPCHAVVERRLVERRQLDRAGDVEDPRLRVARRQLGEELLLLPPHRRDEPERRRHARQHKHARQEVPDTVARAIGGEDPVEHALAEQHDGACAQPAHELQRDRDRRLAASGRPDDPQRGDEQPREIARRPGRGRRAVQCVDRESGFLAVGGHAAIMTAARRAASTCAGDT